MDKFIMRKTKSKIQKVHVLVTQNDQSSQTTNSTQSCTECHDNVKVKIPTKEKGKGSSTLGLTKFCDKYCPSPK